MTETLKGHLARLVTEFDSGRVDAVQITWARLEPMKVEEGMVVEYQTVYEGWTAYQKPEAGFALLGFNQKYAIDTITSLNAMGEAIRKKPDKNLS